MHLMGDSLTVLGARLGVAWDPAARIARLVRHTTHPGLPLQITAGVTLGERTLVLPLTPEGETFDFLDQTMAPTTMSMGGIDPEAGIHVKLTVRIPFRPRDTAFSTVPAVFFDLQVDRLPSGFRWLPLKEGPVSGTVTLGFGGDGFTFAPEGDALDVCYKAAPAGEERPCALRDRVTALSGKWSGSCLEAAFTLRPGELGATLSAAWCAYDAPVLEVMGERCPFKYTQQFASLEDVADWARRNHDRVQRNAERVDSLLEGHSLGVAVSHLMAQSLHSWLSNTWWVVRPDGQDWFTVWEGSCYFHSTVDVEFTQSPFYLTVWPELLEMELDEWPLFAKDGAATLGESGAGTLFLSHDMGMNIRCCAQAYPHEMEVEETANYLLLAYALWRRTGRHDVFHRHADLIRRFADFLVASDSTGNGIPDQGCANTVDDASPAIQFGAEQVYLGVKAMAACQAAVAMLQHAGNHATQKYTDFAGRARATLESKGWQGDHYAVTTTRSAAGLKDPWTGQPLSGELKGWDAYHIYTANGLAPLDMVGFDTGLNRRRLRQDLATAAAETLGRYDCRHTSYVEKGAAETTEPGLLGIAPTVGWVSMNMLRDIAAAYRGEDLLSMAERYWDYQCVTNAREFRGFFETFYGNNLCFYPRGVAVFGYLDAAAGFAYDAVSGAESLAPVRASLTVPLLLFADWEVGRAPVVKTYLQDGQIEHTLEGLA